MAERETFRKAVSAAGSGIRIPAMSLIREDRTLAATLSKLTPARVPAQYDREGNRTPEMPNTGMLRDISNRTAQNISDAQTVLQILPDMELGAQILVSSILSPKDMMTTELNFTVTEGFLSPEVSAALLSVSRTFFEKTYKIKPLLSKILHDALFTTGSYALAVIPENSLDEMINGTRHLTMESLSEVVNSDGTPRLRGLLGPAVAVKPKPSRRAGGVSLESLDFYQPMTEFSAMMTLEGIIDAKGVNDHLVTVVDNPDMLKVPEINQKIREQRISTLLKTGARKHFGKALEAYEGPRKEFSKMNDRDLSGVLFRDRKFAYKPIAVAKTQDQLMRRTVGNPLILHLPSEAVIPVHIPGSPEKHVGFFVLLDADGNPIRKEPNQDYYQQLGARLNGNGSFASAMLNKLKTMTQGQGFDPRSSQDLDLSARAYGQLVEQDLLSRLRNGAYGNGVAIAKKEEVWRIMFARALAQQHTQLLFLPAELVTYFAFKYNDDGTGKSLLDDMKILTSLRAMLTFSNVMAAVKNSIGKTEVKLKLDPDDPHPNKTIELAMHQLIANRAGYFPVGVSRPHDLVDFLQRAGFEFTYEGHPGIPDVSVNFGEKSTQYVKPDTELEDTLRKRTIMGMYLSPENVDAGFTADFATSVLNNNILLSKRVLGLQEIFTPQLSDNLRKVMMNSEDHMTELRKVLEENFSKLEGYLSDEAKEAIGKQGDVKGEMLRKEVIDQLLMEYVLNFEVQLPQPNTVTLENQLKSFETYNQALDKTIEAYLSEKFYTSDTGGETATHVGVLKEILKAYFQRQWLAENGVMTEMSKLTTLGEGDKPAIDIMALQKEHLEGLTKSFSAFLSDLQPYMKKADEKLTEAGVTAGSSTGSTDAGGGGDDGFDFGGGSPDFTQDADNQTPGDGQGGTGTAETEETQTPGAEGEGGEAGAAEAGKDNKPAAGAEEEDEEGKGKENPPAAT